MPQALFNLAEREGIIVRWWDFVPPVRGLYCAPRDMPPVIGLDKSLEHNRRILRCVLAEELGHHFTTSVNSINRTFCSYEDRVWFSREEYRAHRWAALHLIPPRRLGRILRSGNMTLWDLADIFDVTEEMMRFRLGLLEMLVLRSTGLESNEKGTTL